MTSSAEALNDAQLIDHIRSNDAAAFAELRRRHQTDAIRTARIVAHDPSEAERVADATFERLHADLVAGSGPHRTVSPYLRTMIRRGALDAHRTPVDEHEAVDPAAVDDLPHVTDPLTAAEDRNIIREAYESLPERWQRALWFTEVEGRTPTALVPDLGSAASAVAAMAYRAREGLRQAYLAVHMSVAMSAECRPVVANLPAYVREALSPEDDVAVAIHLDTCLDCRNRRYELLLLVSNLRGVLAPALLGYRAGTPAATRPVAVAAGQAARTSAAAAIAAVGRWPRRAVKVAATAAACVLAAAALAWAASSAFAPTTPADAASGDHGPLAVTFEQTSEPPAVTMNPMDLLDGVPDEADEDPADDEDRAETDSSDRPAGDGRAAGAGADTSGNERRSDAGTGPAGGDSTADSGDDDTSGSQPENSSTTGSAGGGAAAGAPGGESSDNGSGNGGNQSPPDGSNSDPDEEPEPPTGDDGDSDHDEEVPTDPGEGTQEPGTFEQLLCDWLSLC